MNTIMPKFIQRIFQVNKEKQVKKIAKNLVSLTFDSYIGNEKIDLKQVAEVFGLYSDAVKLELLERRSKLVFELETTEIAINEINNGTEAR